MLYIVVYDNIYAKYANMPTVAAIAIEGCYASSLTGFIDLLHVANAYTKKQLGNTVEPFEWKILSLTGEDVVSSNGLTIQVKASTSTTETYDLIYIPGLFYQGSKEFNLLLEQHQTLGKWLSTQSQGGALISANCTGTFVLAESGLLNKRRATTTWWLAKQFKRRYPHVKLDINQLITDDQGLICAGAITTYQQLAIRMVEHFISPAIASLCAKALLVDLGQTTQTPYLSLSMDDSHTDKLVAKAEYRMQQNLHQTISIKELADSLNVSQRTLVRRFNYTMNISPLTYLQNLRIEAAKKLLETTNISIEAVIENIGYEDISSFSRLFKKRTGLSPAAYRQRFLVL